MEERARLSNIIFDRVGNPVLPFFVENASQRYDTVLRDAASVPVSKDRALRRRG